MLLLAGFIDQPSYLPVRDTYGTAWEATYLAFFTLTAAAWSRILSGRTRTQTSCLLYPEAVLWFMPTGVMLIIAFSHAMDLLWVPLVYLLLPLTSALAVFASSGRIGAIGRLALVAGLAVSGFTGNRHAVGMYLLCMLIAVILARRKNRSLLSTRSGRESNRFRLTLIGVTLLAMPLFVGGTLLKFGSSTSMRQIQIRVLLSQAEGHAALTHERLNPTHQQPPLLTNYYKGLLPGYTRSMNIGVLTYTLSRTRLPGQLAARGNDIPYASSSPSAEFFYLGGYTLVLIGAIFSGCLLAFFAALAGHRRAGPAIAALATMAVTTFLGVGNSGSYTKLSFLIELVAYGIPTVIVMRAVLWPFGRRITLTTETIQLNSSTDDQVSDLRDRCPHVC